MWIPKSEEEIVNAVNSDALEESAIFDAKVELPSKNIEIAKDIAAMSNDGGVIIYGIGEDENGRLRILAPVDLKGQPERITSIAQTSIAEPPRFTIQTIPTNEDSSKGYIIVVIPPSERAPHMVVVKGDHRYYGRNAKGNFLLSEADVARLYERRKRLKIDLMGVLETEIQAAPYKPNSQFGYLHAFIRPAFEIPGILDRIDSTSRPRIRFLEDTVENIAGQNLLHEDYYPRFNPYHNTWDFTSNGVRGRISYSDNADDEAVGDALIIQVDSIGSGHFFCGRIAELENHELRFFWQVTIGNTVNFMLFMGELFREVNYIGMVDIGLAITGIKGAIYHSRDRVFRHLGKTYESDDYKTIGRIDAPSLAKSDSVINKAEEMLAQFLRALTQGRENPFDRLRTK